jgi:type IX secretion system PorP/SprF family membrane protein
MLELKYLSLLIMVLFLWKIEIQAQDIHFSQFYTTPILTNPANTGISGEDARVACNYRNQWAKIGVPFNTLYASLDRKLVISNQKFGIGGLIIHDQSSFNLTANEFLLSLSYSKIIHNQQLVFGVQPGFVTKSFNLTGLTFGSQFDQVTQQYNVSLPSSESGLTGNLHYFDMNVGVFWRTLIRNIMPSAGVSVSHVLKPVETFSSASSGTRIPRKLIFNGQVIIPLSSKFEVTPCLLYGHIPGANELLIGAVEGYSNKDFIPVKKVYAITMLRLNPSRNIDALILGGGVYFTKFNLGISYDTNVSPLAKASNFNGAFEISLIFTGGHTQKNINGPCHIY